MLPTKIFDVNRIIHDSFVCADQTERKLWEGFNKTRVGMCSSSKDSQF